MSDVVEEVNSSTCNDTDSIDIDKITADTSKPKKKTGLGRGRPKGSGTQNNIDAASTERVYQKLYLKQKIQKYVDDYLSKHNQYPLTMSNQAMFPQHRYDTGDSYYRRGELGFEQSHTNNKSVRKGSHDNPSPYSNIEESEDDDTEDVEYKRTPTPQPSINRYRQALLR